MFNFDLIPQVDDTEMLTEEEHRALIDVFDQMHNEYVPKSGIAPTVGGELLRAMMRILYRAYNDGDMIGDGQNHGQVESSMAYIFNCIEYYLCQYDAKRLYFAEISFLDLLEDIKAAKTTQNAIKTFNERKSLTQKSYIYHIEDVAITLMQILKNNQFLFECNNDTDSRDISEESFIRAMEMCYGITEDDMFDAYLKYQMFLDPNYSYTKEIDWIDDMADLFAYDIY